MKHFGRMVAFVSGVALYCIVVLGSALAANSAVPRAYAALVAAPGTVALAFAEAVVIAVMVFVLGLAWTYAMLLLYRNGRREATAWCVGGLALAWVGWVMYGAMTSGGRDVPDDVPVASLLLSSVTPPLWGILNAIAAPAGVLLGGALVRRSHPSVRRRRRSAAPAR